MSYCTTPYLNFLKEKQNNTTQQLGNTDAVKAVIERHYERFTADYMINGSDRSIICSCWVNPPTDKKRG